MTVPHCSIRSPRNDYLADERRSSFWKSSQLFLASLLTLYFEVLLIRYLTAEVRVFTNLKNFPLIASFFGIGLGIMLGAGGKSLRRFFPLIAILLFLPIRFASLLHYHRSISLGVMDWVWVPRLCYGELSTRCDLWLLSSTFLPWWCSYSSCSVDLLANPSNGFHRSRDIQSRRQSGRNGFIC